VQPETNTLDDDMQCRQKGSVAIQIIPSDMQASKGTKRIVFINQSGFDFGRINMSISRMCQQHSF
jgi:hypothetical protein